MALQTQQAPKVPKVVICRGDHGVVLTMAERQCWLGIDAIRLDTCFNLDNITKVDYRPQAQQLTITLNSQFDYIQIPCSIEQAKQIVRGAGWEVDQMKIEII
jgi:hypothetical protein